MGHPAAMTTPAGMLVRGELRGLCHKTVVGHELITTFMVLENHLQSLGFVFCCHAFRDMLLSPAQLHPSNLSLPSHPSTWPGGIGGNEVGEPSLPSLCWASAVRSRLCACYGFNDSTVDHNSVAI